jgi:IclR family transcriptional regulator, acetate operon repressor
VAERAATAEGSVRAVERALDILLAFKPHDDALTVNELLGRVALSRPTLYRLLRTLQAKEFLTVSDNPKRFRLGPAVAQLAHVWTSVLDLAAAAEPMMRRLWVDTSETVALFVREDLCRVCLAELPSAQALSFRRGVGYRESLAVGASGKAILAYLPDGEPGGLRAEAKRHARELAQIRGRGFAVSKSELIEGAVAVSAPFFNGSGEVIGSVSVFGPSIRLSDARISTFARLLIRETRKISQVLGKAATDGSRQARGLTRTSETKGP